MKKRYLLQILSILGVLLLIASSGYAAYDLVLETDKESYGIGESLTLHVVLSGTDTVGVGGAAFTISYPSNILTGPTTDAEGVSQGITSEFIFTVNGTSEETHRGKVESGEVSGEMEIKLAGATIDETSGGSKGTITDGAALFSINFTVKDDEALVDSTAEFTLKTTEILNTDAGYGVTSGQAEPVTPLVGAVAQGEAGYDNYTCNEANDPPCAFPTLLSDVSGSLSVDITDAITDSDGDGLDDAWEMQNFGDLETANGTTDTDLDGYTDIKEEANGSDPNVVNTSDEFANYDSISDVSITNPDIDGNGAFADNDVLLFRRWDSGLFPGDSLIEGRGIISQGATRDTAQLVIDYCSSLTSLILDVDGDGAFGDNDLLLFRRWDSGLFPGDSLVDGRGIITDQSTRKDADAIRTYLEKLKTAANSK